MILFSVFASSTGITFLLGLTGYALFRRWALKQAHIEARELLKDAHAELEIVDLDIQEKTSELEQKIFAPHEKEFARIEEHIEDLTNQIESEKANLEQKAQKLTQTFRQNQSRVDSYDHKVKELASELSKIKEEKLNKLKTFRQKLIEKVNLDTTQETQRLAQLEIQDWESYLQKWVKECEAQTQDQVEPMAKKLLGRALARFHRPYSAERGIPYVELDPERPAPRQKLCDPQGENLKAISEVTGCDLLVEDGMDYIAIGGFDPVRREFARRVLERALREKQDLNPNKIKQFAENIKKELFAHIKRDGDLLTKELGLQNMHIEIRKMMGSLRYRYSFTQNQYFHCGEVGWLAGLLATELGGVELKKARRAGMLHDLGKAMDHEFEGGHAVIGANFIEQHGEAPDIVHAVKAHHYDETPSTLLAYLVIAADAISGARPGARRSTVESYNQKITDLENIARSFPGVSDCIILNGGRECRVKVDSHRVDDLEAAKIARDVAERIETECSYPGQIKVVVVRETVATEAKSQRHK